MGKKIISIILLITLTTSLKLETGLALEEKNPEQCYQDLKQLVLGALKLKDMKSINDLVLLILSLIQPAKDLTNVCVNLTPADVNQVLNDHFNQEGKDCFMDIHNDWAVLYYLYEDVKYNKVTLQDFVDRITPVLQSIPKVVQECKDARLH